MTDLKDELSRTAHKLMLQVQRNREAAERSGLKPAPALRAVPTLAVPDTEPARESSLSPDLESWWLPDPVQRWVDSVSAFFGVPKTMPIAAAMCAAATVVQGKVSVEMAPGIIQPLTLWWAVLARTGGRKSSVLNLAKAPLAAMQAAELARIKPDIIERTKERARLEQQIARMRRATKAHRHTEGAQEHMTQLRELEHELEECEIPIAFRWLYDNINPAMLPQVLERNLESEDGIARATIWGEEGTFFANVIGRHSGIPMAETCNQAYSGSALDSTRKLEGTRQLIDIHIDRTFMTLCVFCQPHYREKLRNQELADNGFLARLLISECAVGPRPTDRRPPPSDAVLRGYSDWLHRLAAIPEGTVHVLSRAAQDTLARHIEETDALALAGEEGAGWALRSAERVARLVALTELGELSHVSRVSHMAAARGHVAGDIKVNYLISSIYSAYIREAQAQEPSSPSPRRDAEDLWDRWDACHSPKVGELWTTRQLSHLKKRWTRERVLDAAHELVSMGLLEPEAAPIARGRKTLKEVFRVVRLSLGNETPLRVVPDPPVQLADHIGPDDDQPPSGDEYLGAEDFEVQPPEESDP